MRSALLKFAAISFFAAASSVLLTSCGTAPIRTAASRTLPAYEPPIAQADLQTVRTTAYTHSESDHLAYGARNALGGVLQSATVPEGPFRVLRAIKVTEVPPVDDLTIALVSRDKHKSKASKKQQARNAKAAAKSDRTAKAEKAKAAKVAKTNRKLKGGKLVHVVHQPQPPRIGSAAADWARWPAGTTFRVVSTGQVYRVDDYGWALAGRNTIDLYMSSREEMNRWGVRSEPIEVLHWGDRQASLALLAERQSFKHCRRMMLELQERHEEAAALH